ncbi:group II intron maturase-specific domain-containing protein [Streptomyces sp. NPDC005507]|uniref:group II intron maturase-specific domain-containing protein n=1 Tax=Streptomyces sp. NPDC005507 TaxID=3154885 RepID=UPI0033B6FC8A
MAPQGSPFSPLLSNIMLDDLDRELFKRSLRFVRYADDVMIFVRSERAANRVLESVTTFIEMRLKLKVNREKCKAAPAFKVSLLGFGYYRSGGKGPVKIRIDRKAVHRLKKTVRTITSRSWGVSMEHRLEKLRRFMTGWVAYFKVADSSWTFKRLDEWTRRRLRQVRWIEWKNATNRVRMVRRLGREVPDDVRLVAGHRKWKASLSIEMNRALDNAYWDAQGYKSFAALWQRLRTA